jgi:hypothetical protein
VGQHRPARSCQAQHRRAGTTPAAAQGLRRKQGARARGGEAERPGALRRRGRVPGPRAGSRNPVRGRGAENPGLRAWSREPWPCGRGAENPGPGTGSREPWPCGRGAENPGPGTGSREPWPCGRGAESPRAPPATGHQRHREPRRAIRLGTRCNKRCAPRSGGVTRHGDRLDKAGQPGGPVSAVYSPAAACAARSASASRHRRFPSASRHQYFPVPVGGGALSR